MCCIRMMHSDNIDTVIVTCSVSMFMSEWFSNFFLEGGAHTDVRGCVYVTFCVHLSMWYVLFMSG